MLTTGSHYSAPKAASVFLGLTHQWPGLLGMRQRAIRVFRPHREPKQREPECSCRHSPSNKATGPQLVPKAAPCPAEPVHPPRSNCTKLDTSTPQPSPPEQAEVLVR